VPSFLTYVAKSGVLKKNRIPTLRAITFCGEVMPTKTIIEWMKVCPDIRYVNQYGPTETTCASMYYEIDKLPEDHSIPIPIGKAIPNTEPFAVNESGELLRPGEIGELLIRGVGNSLGYWNNEEKTKRAFIQNPVINNYNEIVYATGDMVRSREDGLFDFVGRKDSQIKYMGYRIEPGDIENALDSIGSIASSAVLGIENDDLGGMLIVAFICLCDKVSLDLIKQELEKKLPSYMIPKKFYILDKMPLNPNGKVDRLVLKQKYCK
jgi:acyl-coenzyme A synthetase/AMP-(fatty) acid ligase